MVPAYGAAGPVNTMKVAAFKYQIPFSIQHFDTSLFLKFNIDIFSLLIKRKSQ
jgi:hypothetical protein